MYRYTEGCMLFQISKKIRPVKNRVILHSHDASEKYNTLLYKRTRKYRIFEVKFSF